MSAAVMDRGFLDVASGDPVCRYEIVDGIEVEVPPMGIYAEKVAQRTLREINRFLDHNDLGEAEHEALYDLRLPRKQKRRPDVSFVSYLRSPKDRPWPYRGNARDVVPDLAVEVISPNDLVEEIMTKIDEFFRAGVRLVWVIYPSLKMIYVYTSPTAIRVLLESDELDGGDVLPGLKIAIASLFPPMLPDDVSPSGQ